MLQRQGPRITRKYQLGRDKLDMSTTTTWQSFIASLATVVTCSGTAVCNLICSPFVLENSRICSIWCTAYNNPVVQHHHSVFLNIDSNVHVLSCVKFMVACTIQGTGTCTDILPAAVCCRQGAIVVGPESGKKIWKW